MARKKVVKVVKETQEQPKPMAQAQAQAQQENKTAFPPIDTWAEYTPARAWAAIGFWAEGGDPYILLPTSNETLLVRLEVVGRYPKNVRMAAVLVERLRARLK